MNKKNTKNTAPQLSDDSEEEVTTKKVVSAGKAEPKHIKSAKEVDEESEDIEEEAEDDKSEKEEETHSELFIKNLSWNSTEDSVAEHFARFGKVLSVKLLNDKMTGKPKGIGFIKFEKRADAKKAMADAGELDGRTPNCSWSNEKGDAKPRGDNKFEKRPERSNNSGDSHTIFVGNLGFKTNENTIKKFFSRAGNIVGIRIAMNEDGRAKGFCHVDFDSSEAVQKAISYAGQEIDGREIRVDASEARKPREGGFGGGRGRGGFRGGESRGFGGGRGGFRGGDSRGRGGFRGGNRGGNRDRY